MKKTLLTIALCAAAAFANGPKDHGPKTPDIKTPTKPDVGPKAASTPRAPQSRTDTVDRPCDRLVDVPLWCPRP